MKNKILNLLILIMCMNLIFMPSLVFASAAEKLPDPTNIYTNPNGNTSGTSANDGWYNTKVERNGATTIYHGEKKVGDKIYTGRSQTRPTLTQVLGKVIRVGVGASVVVDALDVLLDGVDYVMYEENNKVKFRTNEPVICYMMGSPCFSTEEEAEAYVREYYDNFWRGKSYEFQRIRKANNDIDFVATGTYSDGRPDVRTSPYYWKNKVATAEEVSEQILKDAEKGKAPAEEFVGKIADENTPQSKKNEDYEASKMIRSEPSTNQNSEPKQNENIKNEPQQQELPAFCTWAKTVCDFIDWAKTEPEIKDEPTKIDIVDTDIGDWRSKANSSYVNGGGGCPADLTIPINWGGISSSINISYEPFCYFASMIKPAVIMGAWISGLMIVTGGRSKE